jgi:hypothetical protein
MILGCHTALALKKSCEFHFAVVGRSEAHHTFRLPIEQSRADQKYAIGSSHSSITLLASQRACRRQGGQMS